MAKTTLNPSLTEPFGVTGLPRWGGRVYDEFLPELQGPRGRRVFREMADNDPIVGSILFAVEMLIRRVTWSLTPGSDDTEGEQHAEFVDAARGDMAATWEDTLSDILSFLPYGWSLHELIYKRRRGPQVARYDDEGRLLSLPSSKYNDGLIGWHSWPIRAQETLLQWEFDALGAPVAMIQLGPPDYVLHRIPLEKALLFRTKAPRGNPEGRSMLRNAYRPWYFKKNVEQIEGIGIERDLAGLPVIYADATIMGTGATPDEAAMLESFKNLVSTIRRDEQEGVIMPLARDERGDKLYELGLLTTGGTRQFDTDAIIGRYDSRISMTILADFVMLGHEQVGTQAVGQTKSKLFTAALGAWLDSICAIVNEMAIPRLLALNGIVTDTPPQLAHGEIDDMDLEAVGAFLANLSAAGAQLDLAPGSPLSNTLLRGAGLPEISPEEADKLKAEQQAEADRAAQQAAQNTPAPGQQSAPAKTAPTPARPRAPTRGKKAP